VHDLYAYLNEGTADAVCGFVQAFVYSMPTGKQNTFANRTLPDTVMVTLRADQPANFVGAFERPVRAGRNSDEGYVAASGKALVEHAKKIYGDWLGHPERALVTGSLLEGLGETMSFEKLRDTLKNELDKSLAIGGEGK